METVHGKQTMSSSRSSNSVKGANRQFKGSVNFASVTMCHNGKEETLLRGSSGISIYGANTTLVVLVLMPSLCSKKTSNYIADYQGELIPPCDTDSRYMFDIDNHTRTTIGYMDSLRPGIHSCNPNAAFSVVRLGSEATVVIRLLEKIDKETEITVNDGESTGSR